MSAEDWVLRSFEEELQAWSSTDDPTMEEVRHVLDWAAAVLDEGPPQSAESGLYGDFFDRVPYTRAVVSFLVVEDKKHGREVIVLDISTL